MTNMFYSNCDLCEISLKAFVIYILPQYITNLLTIWLTTFLSMRHLTKKIEPYHNILSCDNLFQSHGEDPTKSE